MSSSLKSSFDLTFLFIGRLIEILRQPYSCSERRGLTCVNRIKPAYALFAAAQRVDIDRQRLDRHGIEPTVPGRHHAGATVGDGLDEDGFVRTIQPDLVSEVRRAELLITLPALAVAASAIL